MSADQTPDPLDEHFEDVMRMLNGAVTDPVMDDMVSRIVAKVHAVIAEVEAAESFEHEAEFLADPMHFGRAES